MAESMIWYGESGSTKTSQLANFAKWLYEKTGKRTRLITGDGGGFKPIEDAGLIEFGIVEVMDLTATGMPLATLRRLSKGQWYYNVKDASGKINRQMCNTPEKHWEKIGAYAVEGLGSISDVILNHIANQPEKVMYENVRWEEDGETFGSNNEGHYGLVQKEMYATVMAMKSLPLEYTIWTSLVGRGEDKKTKETVYGPQVAGNKKTPVAPQWFGSCLHFHKFMVENKDSETGIVTYENSPVAFFVDHPDEQTGIRYLAKPRCAPSEYPKLKGMFPGGYISMTPEIGIEQYFNALEKLRKGGTEVTKEWKDKVDAKRIANSNNDVRVP